MAADLITAPWDLGLYPQADAARYSGIPASTVHRWLARRDAVPSEDGFVSFDELVSLLFVRQLRKRGVPLREIITAEADLRQRSGDQHPFAHETLWTAGRDILVRPREAPDEFISANRRGQIAIAGVVAPRVVTLQVADATGDSRIELPVIVASVRGEVRYAGGRVVSWQPTTHISAAPAVQFGATCIEGTRLPTRALYDAARAGDGPAEIARLFRVDEADVRRAVDWELSLAA